MLIFHSHLMYRNILLLLWFTFFLQPNYSGPKVWSHYSVLRTEVAVVSRQIPPFVFVFFFTVCTRSALYVYIFFYCTLVTFMPFYKLSTTGFLCFGVLCNFASTRSSERNGPLMYQCSFFCLFAVTRLLTCYNLEALAAGHTLSPAIFYYTNSWTFCFVPLLCAFTADVRDLPVREFDSEAP